MPQRSSADIIPGMEGFVRAIVAGGASLLGGLWLGSLFDMGSPPWILGVVLSAVGVAGLGYGIWSEIER